MGDNYILSTDPEEQTFRVSKIIKHGKFKPLSADGTGDGRHDIALVIRIVVINAAIVLVIPVLFRLFSSLTEELEMSMATPIKSKDWLSLALTFCPFARCRSLSTHCKN